MNMLENLILATESGADDVNFARKLIQFHFWENQRVWDLAIAPLTDEQFRREVKFLRASVQSECLRIIDTESIYLQSILGTASVPGLLAKGAADRAAIAASWTSARRAWTAFADELDGDKFFSSCKAATDSGPRDMQVWQLIFHVLYHGTARRACILRLVAEVNQPVTFDLSLLQHLTGLLRQ